MIGFDGVGPELAVADVVVSTIPAAAGASVARDAALRKVRGALLDAVYDPVDTPLARAWRDAGGTAVDGTRMLLHQAAEQVRLFTGETGSDGRNAQCTRVAFVTLTHIHMGYHRVLLSPRGTRHERGDRRARAIRAKEPT